jgi:hypothetical protein
MEELECQRVNLYHVDVLAIKPGPVPAHLYQIGKLFFLPSIIAIRPLILVPATQGGSHKSTAIYTYRS